MAETIPTIPPPSALSGGATNPGVATEAKSGASATAPNRVADGASASIPGEIVIGKPGYKFRHAVDSPLGQEERREHERLRKQSIRSAKPASEPPPLRPASVSDQVATPMPGESFGPGASPVEIVVAWRTEDVAEFTDELVELSEAKRISEFVAVARKANLPPKFIAELEKDSGYGTKTKAALKRAIASVAAKWMNKTGVSAKNKEEAALLFAVVTIKMQGHRLRTDLEDTIRREWKRAEEAGKDPKTQTPKDARLV